MERSVTVRTPESIAFYYELAGLGSRFLAVFVDMVIQVVATILVIILGALGAQRTLALAAALHLSEKSLASTTFAVSIILAFLIWFGYFIIFEKLWNGQTPGKRLLGIRVVRDGGYPMELLDSITRNLVRIFELSLGFYFLSAISMLLSSENKRLGDYAAGTIVVRDRAFEVPDPKLWLRPTTFDLGGAPGLSGAALSAEEIALVERYIARKTSLNPKAAHQAAAKIAATMRPRLGPEFAALGDDELLMKIASRET